MADVTIGSLPGITALDDESLIPVEQQGDAHKLTGAQIKLYAQSSVSQYVTQAQQQAQAAANSATQAAGSATQASDSASAAEESASEATQAVSQIGTAVEETLENAQAAQAAQTASESAKEDAETAKQDAESAKDASLAAQQAAEDARDLAEGYSTSAGTSASTAAQKATEASDSATAAAGSASSAHGYAENAGEQAQAAAGSANLSLQYSQDAEAAKEAIESLGVAGETLAAGQSVQVVKTVSEQGVVTLTFRIPQGPQGTGITNITVDENGDLIITLDNQQTIEAGHVKGEPGDSVTSTQRISGTGAPGTTDTWGMYNQKGEQIGSFETYNGQDGTGAGDMTKAVYDPNNMNQDIFAYVDSKVQALREEILGMNIFVVQPEGD